MKGGIILHVHVVQRGDTLWKIAKQYGVSFDEVKRLNAHLANPDYVVPGMKIFVPEQSAKVQGTMDHPYNNDRPVKKNKEEYTIQPAPKPTQAVPQSVPAPLPMPQSVPKPTMQPAPAPAPAPTPAPAPAPMPAPKPVQQPKPQPVPKPLPQPNMQQPAPQPMPMPQPVPQYIPMPQPINQHLTMTQMMPPYMGIPYGWIPVPDMDLQHAQVLPTQQAPAPAPVPAPAPAPVPTKPMPALKPEPELKPMPQPAPNMKPTHPHGWQLLDSSSLREIETSSMDLTPYPTHQQPMYQQPMQQDYQQHFRNPSPCGCGQHNQGYDQPAYEPTPYPTQMLGANQDQYSMMPQHHMMMAPQMSPYMACTPCQMWPAPQGHWGYPTPFRPY